MIIHLKLVKHFEAQRLIFRILSIHYYEIQENSELKKTL